MTLTTILKETAFPRLMNKDLAKQWADGIPRFPENDLKNPEWKATPTVEFDLTSYGYGIVHVKDESVNPTHTAKDRPVWELTAAYRDYAQNLLLRDKHRTLTKQLEELPVPRFSLITSGNAGRSLAHFFEKYSLPPPHLLVPADTPTKRLEVLKNLYVNIYLVDMGKHPLTPEEILKLTNNEHGVDITSTLMMEPHAVFYDWHVHESFNEQPDQIFVPYGSGRLMENYLTWQYRNSRNKDPRLKIDLAHLTSIDILGAEPEDPKSKADKLTKSFHPFAILGNADRQLLLRMSFTGESTGVYKIPEEKILEAYTLMKMTFVTEESGSAGLALYLHRWDKGLVNPRDKILVVNTGKGI